MSAVLSDPTEFDLGGSHHRSLTLLRTLRDRGAQRLFYQLYPEEDTIWTGPPLMGGLVETGQTIHSRYKYAKHIEWLGAGAKYRERCAMMANRVGKTFSLGGYEMACHLTGLYPDWWVGRRFTTPISAWAAGDTFESTRDIIQLTLVGEITLKDGKKMPDGRGIIPGHLLGRNTWRTNPADLVDTIIVKHVTGRNSFLGFKSYDQGRKKFQGTGRHVCIAEGELVQMADGTTRPIEDILAGDMVLSITRRGKVVKRAVLGVTNNGVKECISLQSRRGSRLILTPDHQVYRGYMPNNKRRADEIDHVAQLRPSAFWPEITESRPDGWYAWAGLVVSDGSTSCRKVTNGNESVMAKATAMLPECARVRRKSFAAKHNHVPDWFLYWDDFWADIDVNLCGNKRIPSWVFTAPKEKAALFLRWLFFGDGWVNGHTIRYATTSHQLATEVQILLSRLGIKTGMAVRPAKGKWAEQYWVQVTKADDVIRFVEAVGVEGKPLSGVHKEALTRRQSLRNRGRHLHPDGDFSGDSPWRERGLRQKNIQSRVTKRYHVGPRRVYDLTVEGEHRYFVGTNLVSNCWFDEEPPADVYNEALIRTATLNGIIMLTFTPLSGMSEVVLSFMPADQRPDLGE